MTPAKFEGSWHNEDGLSAPTMRELRRISSGIDEHAVRDDLRAAAAGVDAAISGFRSSDEPRSSRLYITVDAFGAATKDSIIRAERLTDLFVDAQKMERISRLYGTRVSITTLANFFLVIFGIPISQFARFARSEEFPILVAFLSISFIIVIFSIFLIARIERIQRSLELQQGDIADQLQWFVGRDIRAALHPKTNLPEIDHQSSVQLPHEIELTFLDCLRPLDRAVSALQRAARSLGKIGPLPIVRGGAGPALYIATNLSAAVATALLISLSFATR